MEVIEEISIEILMLCIKKAKLEKKLNKCLTCTIRRLLSCLGFKKIEQKLAEIEARIEALKNEQNKIKCNTITLL
jgi:hypothetical protein